MPDEQKTPKEQREERFDVSFKGPISALPGIAGSLGLGADAEPESFFGGKEAVDQKTAGGEPEEASMFSQEDIDEFAKRNPPPAGMKMPTATMKSAPPGQRPISIGTGQEVGAAASQGATQAAPQEEAPAPTEPTKEPERLGERAKAFQVAMEPLPEVDTKEEFLETQKDTPWWKKILAAVKYYDPNNPAAGQEAIDRKIDEKYQRHIQPQLEARAERERTNRLGIESAGERRVNIGTKIGLDEDWFIPESQVGSFSSLIKARLDLKNQKTVNFSDIVEGAPDYDLPQDLAEKMIPIIVQGMKDGKVSNLYQFIIEHPDIAKDYQRFLSGLKKEESAAKEKEARQMGPDLFGEKQRLTSDPKQMTEYMKFVGEKFDESEDLLSDESTITGPDGKPIDLGPYADNYLWQRNKTDPRYKDWTDDFLKNEGLAFRKPLSPREINAEAVKIKNASEPDLLMTMEEATQEATTTIGAGVIKRYRGNYGQINRDMRKDKIPQESVDRFLGYHFPDQHAKDMKRRGEKQKYIDAVTKRTQRDEVPSGGVIQRSGAVPVTSQDILDYAEQMSISPEEARRQFERDPDVRIVPGG